MIPQRNMTCRARAARADGNDSHEPVPTTVESESGLETEWQFGICMSCEQSISRFRSLTGGWWFDHWGDIEELAYLL